MKPQLFALLFLALSTIGISSASQAETAAACSQDICVGQRAYNISRNYRQVEVVAIEASGRYVLKFLDGSGTGGNWRRSDLALPSGCSNNLCVGERFYNISSNYRHVEIVAIEYSGRYVLKFLDGSGIGGNWRHSDLAHQNGCGRQFCVGDYALNIKSGYRKIQIVGIQYNGKYVVKFLDGSGVGGNWSDSDLARF